MLIAPTHNQGGLVRLIILIIIGILVLSFFGINIRGIVESPVAQENLGYVWEWVTYVWDSYLADPILYFWNNIFISLLWEGFVNNLQRIKQGEPTDFDIDVPQVELPAS